ncbi:MAG: cytochrome c [Calditrichaeota bacterium]|nr:cytochrome c [Candidatus Cloacimonadota bacterium]MCA9788086.1 cytochrome c [Candidatus Cloacimonadota bacterium]MCB1047574.1 cytochrome c [Calditrichota bacterium]MCB9473260.1 cytochrome c [Candidatus Delongbacteria bacterium]
MIQQTQSDGREPCAPVRRSTQGAAARLLLIPLLAALLFSQGCGDKSPDGTAGGAVASTAEGGLSADELENGIGPAKTAPELGPLNAELAASGQQIFDMKCLSCHRMGERFIGPDLNQILTRRTPRYVMNMILNPTEMVQRHPEAKKLLAEYLAPMAQQNLTQDEARAVLEYIRSPHEAAQAKAN